MGFKEIDMGLRSRFESELCHFIVCYLCDRGQLLKLFQSQFLYHIGRTVPT